MASAFMGSRIVQRRLEEQREQGIVECSLRDPSGQLSPLLRRWRNGRATMQPGHMVFEPFVPFALRMRRPRTDPIAVPVLAVHGPPRRPRGRELLWVTAPIVTIDTGRGEVSWAVPAMVIEWAVAFVQGDQPGG